MKLARPFALLAALAVLVSARLSLAGDPTALLASGQTFEGKLVSASVAWQLGFETDGAVRTLPAGDLVTWGQLIEPARDSLVVLAGGGLISGIQLRIDQE